MPPAQIYFVSRNSDEAVPLAPDEPSTDIGISARWSTDGSLITFPRYKEGEGIWIVDVSTNTVIKKIHSISGLADFSAPIWSPDNQYLAISAGLPNSRDIVKCCGSDILGSDPHGCVLYQ